MNKVALAATCVPNVPPCKATPGDAESGIFLETGGPSESRPHRHKRAKIGVGEGRLGRPPAFEVVRVWPLRSKGLDWTPTHGAGAGAWCATDGERPITPPQALRDAKTRHPAACQPGPVALHGNAQNATRPARGSSHFPALGGPQLPRSSDSGGRARLQNPKRATYSQRSWRYARNGSGDTTPL